MRLRKVYGLNKLFLTPLEIKKIMEVVEYKFRPNETVNIPVHFGHYQYLEVIGHGSFAVVIKAMDLKNKKKVACKLSFRKYLNNPIILSKFEKELRIHKRLDHPNIAPILEILYLDDVIITVMNFYHYGDLYNVMERRKLNEYEILEIAKKLVDALCYLHERGVAHRDIKPENIVLDSAWNPVLIDFGLCTEQKSCLSQTICGTLFFLPPEIINDDEYDAMKADIWSLGITIYVLLTKRYPFSKSNPKVVREEIQHIDMILKSSLGQNMYELLSKMLVVDPSQRKTAQELKVEIDKYLNQFYIPVSKTKPNELKYKRITPQISGKITIKDDYFAVRITKPRVNHCASMLHTKGPIKVF